MHHLIITQCRLSVLKDARADFILDWLERQTHGIVAVQKGHVSKNTQALPFSLDEPITVHEGGMSFVHYRTLTANPLF